MMDFSNSLFRTLNYGCLLQPHILHIDRSIVEYRREGSDVLSCFRKGEIEFGHNHRKFYGFDYVCFLSPTLYGEISVTRNQALYAYGYEITPRIEFSLHRNYDSEVVKDHLSRWIEECLINPFLYRDGILYEMVGRSVLAITDL